MGFHTYESGSAFYLWTRIPEGYKDAMQLNEMLIERAGVAGVPGSAFADSDIYDNYMRLCIAREDEILRGALDKLQQRDYLRRESRRLRIEPEFASMGDSRMKVLVQANSRHSHLSRWRLISSATHFKHVACRKLLLQIFSR